ncbi:MAG: S8 family serine peptidase, partial [Pricia sp.]
SQLMEMSQGNVSVDEDKYIMKGNKMAMIARCKSNVKALAKELRGLGASNLKTYKHTVTFFMNVEKAEKMQACTELEYVRPELKPKKRIGSVQNEAYVGLKVRNAFNQFGVTGKNITIGVLSDSYNALGGEAAGIASGDLPGPGNPNGFVQDVDVLSEILEGGSDEGRGMIELIHDLAPGANIKFYSAFNGYFDFADGIRALADAGCDIIVDDIAYFAEPFFQNGAIAQAVNEVSQQGVLYFSSAGNSGQNSYESDFNSIPNINFHDFDPSGGINFFQTLEVAPGGSVVLTFQWDQPSPFYTDGPGSVDRRLRTDMDIFIFDTASNQLLFQSTDTNPDSSVEIVGFSNPTDEPLFYDLALVKSSGPDPNRLKWIDFGGGFSNVEFATNSSTVVGHANAENALAVGAVAFFNVEGFKGRETTTINGFSSLGGTLLYLNDSGSRKGDPLDTMKPDFTAIDGGNTTFFGSDIPDVIGGVQVENDENPNFFGTSAAAPNAAAVAALMLQANPTLRRQQVANLLRRSAEDLDNPLTEGFDEGYDRKTGYGLVNAVRAVRRSINRAEVDDLALKALCSNDPGEELRWEVFNPNPFLVDYSYRLVGTGQRGEGVAVPGMNTIVTQVDMTGNNRLRINWLDGDDVEQRMVANPDFTACEDVESAIVDKSDFLVYPNPVVSVTTFSYEARQDKADDVIRILPLYAENAGDALMEIPVSSVEGSNQVPMDLSTLQSGIYVLELDGQQQKIIKN